MKKFEYTTLKSKNGIIFTNQVNDLGKQGWELVNTFSVEEKVYITFKREIPEET